MSTHPYGRFTRRGLAGIVGLGLLELILSDEAFGQDEPPAPPLRIYTRREWKARSPRRTAKVLGKAPDRIVVHHTATPNSRDHSLDHAFDLSRQIQRFHMRERGWDDIGQQLTISRAGHVMEGRNGSLASIIEGRHVVGAQALHHNEHTIGIENEGDYGTSSVPGKLWSSLVETCAWLCTEYRLDPLRAIVGHRDLVSTDCPGNVLYSKLDTLRDEVAVHLALTTKDSTAGYASPSPDPDPSAGQTPGPSPSPSTSVSPSVSAAPGYPTHPGNLGPPGFPSFPNLPNIAPTVSPPFDPSWGVR